MLLVREWHLLIARLVSAHYCLTNVYLQLPLKLLLLIRYDDILSDKGSSVAYHEYTNINNYCRNKIDFIRYTTIKSGNGTASNYLS